MKVAVSTAPRTCGLRDTLSFVRDPAAFTASHGHALGDFYRVRLPGSIIYVVTDAALAELILVQQAESFEKSRIYWRELRRSFGDCLGALEGDSWAYLRHAQRPFFSPRAVQELLPQASAQTERELDALVAQVGSGADLPLLDVLSELNARIVLSLLFAQDGGLDVRDITRRITEGHAIIAWKSRYPWRPLLARLTWRQRAGEEHKRYLGAFAEQMRGSAGAADARTLLHALIRLHDDPAAPPLPAELLRNELSFHLGASTETQAAAESWTLYLLWQHPEALERVRDEIRGAAGDSGICAQHLDQLCYTRQVVQEALRLYPPVHAILRDCVRPVELPLCSARPGQSFLISVIGLQRNPRLWPDASSFVPERFAPAARASIGRYHYLPFGAGKHICIGQHLALPTMVLTVAQFAERFDWSFAHDNVRPVAEPSLKPPHPFTARLRARRGSK